MSFEFEAFSSADEIFKKKEKKKRERRPSTRKSDYGRSEYYKTNRARNKYIKDRLAEENIADLKIDEKIENKFNKDFSDCLFEGEHLRAMWGVVKGGVIDGNIKFVLQLIAPISDLPLDVIRKTYDPNEERFADIYNNWLNNKKEVCEKIQKTRENRFRDKSLLNYVKRKLNNASPKEIAKEYEHIMQTMQYIRAGIKKQTRIMQHLLTQINGIVNMDYEEMIETVNEISQPFEETAGEILNLFDDLTGE